MKTEDMDLKSVENIIDMPREYKKIESDSAEEDNVAIYIMQTPKSRAIVQMNRIPENGFYMPIDNRDVIVKNIHEVHSERQGLIETESILTENGRRGVYTIVRQVNDPVGTEYYLTFHLYDGSGAINIQGTFYEQGMTGEREAVCLGAMMAKGEIGHDLQGWAEDPYVSSHTRGIPMNLSELPIYDELFPMHPLSLCRVLIQHIVKTS